MKFTHIFIVALVVFASSVYPQPRPADPTSTSAAAALENLPPTFAAQYEGGIFGNSQKEEGSLKFDDENRRVVFFGKNGKEMFAIPYTALLVIYPDSKKSISSTGDVVTRLPVPGAMLGGLLTKSTKYLIVKYDDEEVEVEGTANFKFNEREMLIRFIHALGTKAKMIQRGEAYYRGKKPVF